MKILEAQSAVLSNFEVFQHAVDQRKRYKKSKRRGPPNLENVMRELLQYLRTHPSPLGQDPLTYKPECIKTLIEKLRPYDLSKGEVVMILNVRPATVPALNTILEDMEDRYTEEEQETMVNIISEVLGRFEETAQAEEGEDVAMEEAAA